MKKTFLFGFFYLFSLMIQAALPTSIEGQKLPSLAPMLKETLPSVVNIATEGLAKVEKNPLMDDPFFRFFFDAPRQPRSRKTQSLGSGVIIDAQKGHIITNAHVIKSAHAINVTLNNGKTFKAELIGSDPESDVAVLKINANDLKAVKLSNSETTEVGDFVVAIGNPFGLGQTVTSGIVSALGRTGLGIEGYEDFIQTDASINPGNSGGALVNLNGELVGMNTAILAPSGGNVGIGFAIPSNMVASIVKQLIDFGEVKRGVLGVSMQDISDDLKNAFGAEKIQGGALVTEITPNLAADKAGLKTGDIVLNVNNKPVSSAADVRNAIGLMRVGESFSMHVFRNGKTLILSAAIGQPKMQHLSGKGIHPHLDGAKFTELESTNQKFVAITQIEEGSNAWRTGLRKKDIILSANRKKIDDLKTLEKAIQGNKELLLNIKRGEGAFYLVIR